ncbi:MAG: 7-carboxy-7-deazaguanine synthase QueE [Bacteroidota bacterium]|nr:7-carboxy-7-deazaguanine synthase QueE [Bacteroidota bacterium]
MNNIFKDGKRLPLIEEFYTIQGEGYQAGKAAYFIRIGGCDIGCQWCDTKYSWQVDVDSAVKTSEIMSRASAEPAKAIVVTGGEPCSYNLDFLTQTAYKEGLKTFLETSGSYKITGNWDWICVSPKRQSPPLSENYALSDELKFIIYEEADFEWAEACAKHVGEDCKLYLQPEWSRRKENTPKVVEYIKQNPQWQLSLQSHKLINIP